MQFRLALIAGLLAAGAPLHAASPLEGSWKVSLPNRGGSVIFLVNFAEKDGKWVGKYLDTNARLGEDRNPEIKNVQIKENNVTFDLNLDGEALFTYDGQFIPAQKKVQGILYLGARKIFGAMQPSQLKDLKDRAALARENIEQAEPGEAYFDLMLGILKGATEAKLKPEAVRELVDKGLKAAEQFGTRWQMTTAQNIAKALADQKAYGAIALEQIRQAERMLSEESPISETMQVMELLQNILIANGKVDEAAQMQARLAKLEGRDFAEYQKGAPFKTQPYVGREGKSERVAVVELFTGSECPPCVAADLAWDAVIKTYQPKDAVFLQYHLHVPGPDPMTIAAGEERSEAYAVEGTPTVFVNGAVTEGIGGGRDNAKALYQLLRKAVDKSLEQPSAVVVTAKATRNGPKLTLSATAEGAALPGKDLVVHLVLTEERIRFSGGNGIRYHHNVVRALPGGAKGFAVDAAKFEKSVTVDLDELRKSIGGHLAAFLKENETEFSSPAPGIDLKNLRVVALVQNQKTKEILNAVQVEVEGK